MQNNRTMLCCGIGLLLAALLLASPIVGEPPKSTPEPRRDPAAGARTKTSEKAKPEADRNGTNPFAGKILMVERNYFGGAQWGRVAMEKCEVVEIGKLQLLTGRLLEQPNQQPNQPAAGLKVSIPVDSIGYIIEFDNSEEYEENQGALNTGLMPMAVEGGVVQMAPQVIEFAPPPEAVPAGDVVAEMPSFLPVGQQPAGGLPGWILPYFDPSRAVSYDDVSGDRLPRETREAAKVLMRAGARLFVLSDAAGDDGDNGTKQTPEIIVLIGNEWTGGDAELESAGKISSLLGLYVLGPGRVSDKPLEKLRQGSPAAEIERRSEARLGIDGKIHPKGLMAAAVAPNSAAARAGLEPQDVIVELAGEPIPDMVTYRDVMVPLKPGEKVQMKIWRDGETMSVTIKLGRWE
jgi:hypothetical protein